MAKPNKQKKVFFQKLIDDYGVDNCMTQASSRDIQKNVVSVFKDIAFNNLDINKYQNQLMSPQFIENAVIVIDERKLEHYLHLTSLLAFVSTNGMNENLARLIKKDQMRFDVYNYISNVLYSVKQTGNFGYFGAMNGQFTSNRDWKYIL